MRWSDFHVGLGRTIFYQPELTHITGAATAGIFISNLVQWIGKQRDAEGWIYKTQEELQEETGLTRREQETARKILKDRRLLEEVKRGTPARLYYRVNLDTLNDAVDDYLASKDGGKRHPVETESAILESAKPPSNDGEKRPSIPETTTGITTEKTQKKETAARGGAPSARFSPTPPIAFVPSPERTEAHIERIKADSMTWDDVRTTWKSRKAKAR